jgi:hypothetical protein
MKKLRKFISILIPAFLLLQMFLDIPVFASTQAGIPKNFSVSQTAGKLDISFDGTKNHVKFKWETPTFPNDTDITEKGFKLYTAEPGSNYRALNEVIGSNETSKEITTDGTSNLKSGTLYNAKLTAYHKHTNINNGAVSIDENSLGLVDTISFLTNLNVAVEPAGVDAINIEWSDVKIAGSRIEYDVQVSQGIDFRPENTFVYSVKAENIGDKGPVKPVTGAGGESLLSFTAKGTDFGMAAGTIYYVRIAPKITNNTIIYNPVSSIAIGATNILATVTRMSDEWWKLWWNPVVDPSLSNNIKVNYKILRANKQNSDNPIFVDIGETTDTKFYITTEGIDPNQYFYIVEADIKDATNIVRVLLSERKTTIETPVPVTPSSPDFFDRITMPIDRPDGTVLYDSSIEPYLTANSIEVAWKAPKLADGSIDTDVFYDVWLSTDSTFKDTNQKIQIHNPLFKPISTDFIDIAGDIVAVKYVFDAATINITPNTTYYLQVIAKKNFTINNNGTLESKDLESIPSFKVIITPTGGSIDQPVAPAKPPFKIKLTPDLKEDVGTKNAWVQWSNNWQQLWDGTKWIYVDPAILPIPAGTKTFSYDKDVTFRIGYTLYKDGMNYDSIKDLPVLDTVIPNDMTNTNQFYNIQGLTPNTAYVVWLRAYRTDYTDSTKSLISDVSDPIIVVTKPDSGTAIEKPVVPRFTAGKPGDTFVDLQWTYNIKHTYYIKYSTSPDITASGTEIKITPTDILRSPVIRIDKLNQNTIYYFWIQADSIGDRTPESTSLWSDSYLVKTIPFIKPGTPKGFGVKNVSNAIGKNSVAFQWIGQTGLEYILEFSSDIGYKNSTEKKAGTVSEFTIDGLRSNYRYYVRLYAYDPIKKLRSDPTQSMTVKTLRSTDDYDSDQDIENVLAGPFVITTYANGVWTIKLTGSNADRFIQKVQTDNKLDYKFDLSAAPGGTTKKVVVISNRVFRALSMLKEFIILDNGYITYTIRPYVFNTEQEQILLKKVADFNVEMSLTDSDNKGKPAVAGLNYKTNVSELSIRAVNGSEALPVVKLNKPLKVSFVYTDKNLFSDGKNDVYFNKGDNKWGKTSSVKLYDNTLKKGIADIDTSDTGKAAIMTKTDLTGNYTDIKGEKYQTAIYNILLKHDLKSLPGKTFSQDKKVTILEAAKIMLDVLGLDYGDDVAYTASKAQLISSSDLENTDSKITRGYALYMIDRLYEKMTKTKAPVRPLLKDDGNTITRGDLMIELYNTLKGIGDI